MSSMFADTPSCCNSGAAFFLRKIRARGNLQWRASRPRFGRPPPPVTPLGILCAIRQQTMPNIAGNRQRCYVKLLCFCLLATASRGERMGGDSNPRCLAAHTLSRRAQSTTLSPIQNDLPLPLNLNLGAAGDNRLRLGKSGRGR